MENLVGASAELPPIVLLVEDDDDTRDLYEAALGMSGLWVAKTAEPGDALEYATDLRPDAILMDIGLPTPEDGLSLARAFRQDSWLAQTPIVGVTGFEPEKIQSELDLFTTVFYKPVRLDEVVRRLRWLSAKSAVLREQARQVAARVPQLVAKSEQLLEKAARLRERKPQSSAPIESATTRFCPKCRKSLHFSEQRSLAGTSFDYYAPCMSGCGLFAYDHSRRKMITLVD